MAFTTTVFPQWTTYTGWDADENNDMAGYAWYTLKIDTTDLASLPSNWNSGLPYAATMTITMDGTNYDGTSFTGRTLTYTWTALNNPSWAYNDAVLAAAGVPTNSYQAGGQVQPTLTLVDGVAASAAEIKNYRLINMANGDWNQDSVGLNTRLEFSHRPMLPGFSGGTGTKPGPYEPGSTLTIQSIAFTNCTDSGSASLDNHTMTFAAGWDSQYSSGVSDIGSRNNIVHFDDTTPDGNATLGFGGQSAIATAWLNSASCTVVWTDDGVTIAGQTGLTLDLTAAGVAQGSVVSATVTDTITGESATVSATATVNQPAQGPVLYTQNFDSTTVGQLPSGWTTSGDADWAVTTNSPQAGANCVESGDVADGETSTLEYSAVITEACALTFYWDASSESGYDKLHFYIDGVDQGGEISGTPGYALQTVQLAAAGTYALKWSYIKDGSASSGDDSGRLDTMAIQQIAPASGNNAPTITIDAGSLNQTVVATHAFNMTATAADADGDSLTYQWTATPSAGVTFGTPTAEDTTFVATTAGSYTLEVVATDPSNDTASASTTMTVTAIVTADARTRLDVMKQVNLKLGYAGNEFATKDLVLAEAGVTGYGKVEFGALPLKYMKLDLATGDYASAATDTIVNKAHHDVEVARATAAEVANAALVAAEAVTARAAEVANATAIADEETRALAVEGANATAITGNATAIADEETRALAAESANASAAAAAQATADAIIASADIDLDTMIEVVAAYELADTNIISSITTGSADRALIRTEFITADGVVTNNYIAADGVVTTAFGDADTVLSGSARDEREVMHGYLISRVATAITDLGALEARWRSFSMVVSTELAVNDLTAFGFSEQYELVDLYYNGILQTSGEDYSIVIDSGEHKFKALVTVPVGVRIEARMRKAVSVTTSAVPVI